MPQERDSEGERERERERESEISARLMAYLKESPMTGLSMYSLFECIFRAAITALMHISIDLLYIRSGRVPQTGVRASTT